MGLRSAWVAWLAVCLLSRISLAADAETIGPEFRLPPGPYVLRIEQDSVGEFRGGGPDVAALKLEPKREKLTVVFDIDAAAPVDGSQVLSVVIRKIRHTTPVATFDSDLPQQHGELSEAYASMVDRPFELILEADGRIRQISGMEPIWEAIPSPRRLKEMQKEFGEERVMRWVAKLRAPLPSEPEPVGGTWTSPQFLPLQLPVVGGITYTLEAIEESDAGRLAIISFAARHRGASVPTNPANDGNFESSYTGTSKHDLATGQTRERESDARFQSAAGRLGRRRLPEKVRVIGNLKERVRFAPGRYQSTTRPASP
jgi:hypothetical protein